MKVSIEAGELAFHAEISHLTEDEIKSRIMRFASSLVRKSPPPEYAIWYHHHADGKLIDAIKVMRGHLDLGLKEAKYLAESKGKEIMRTTDKGRAKSFFAALANAGCAVAWM